MFPLRKTFLDIITNKEKHLNDINTATGPWFRCCGFDLLDTYASFCFLYWNLKLSTGSQALHISKIYND